MSKEDDHVARQLSWQSARTVSERLWVTVPVRPQFFLPCYIYALHSLKLHAHITCHFRNRIHCYIGLLCRGSNTHGHLI